MLTAFFLPFTFWSLYHSTTFWISVSLSVFSLLLLLVFVLLITYKIQFLKYYISCCQQSFTLRGTNSVSPVVSILFSGHMLPFLTYAYLYSISHYYLLLYALISGSLLSKTSLLRFWAWKSWAFIVLPSDAWRCHLW